MSSIKNKAVNGIIWSALDNFVSQGLLFIVGIILARLLSPREFGLIGMIAIFLAVSDTFVNSGFASALIRKKNCSQADYSTVFYYNIGAGVTFFLLLLSLAPVISRYFNEPDLKKIIQILGIVLIIDAFSIVQKTKLIKDVNFRLQTKISVVSSLISGAFAITLACHSFGVWSIVILRLSRQTVNSILLWKWVGWSPSFIFSYQSFKELFGFGKNLLLSGLLETAYRNSYYFIVGKFFSAQELGYLTRADQFSSIPSQNLNNVIGRVTYPIMAKMRDDLPALKRSYKRIIKSTMFICFLLMVGLFSVSESATITLIGEQWRPSIIYLKLLCFVAMFYPLQAINLNMLKVQGRSDLFFKLEVIKKILALPAILIGVYYGIKAMILCMCVNTLIEYYLNSYYSGKYVKYSMKEQILDLLPSLFMALLMGVVVTIIGKLLPYDYLVILVAQIFAGFIIMFLLSEFFKIEAYLSLKTVLRSRWNERDQR